MSQTCGLKQQATLDFPTVFGNTPDDTLFEELKEKLDLTMDVEVFVYAHRWFYANLENSKAIDDHTRFKETGEMPYYAKVLLFRFYTEEGFAL